MHLSAQVQAPLRSEAKSSPSALPTTELTKRHDTFNALPWILCGLCVLALLANILFHRGTDSASASRRMSNDHPVWQRRFVESRPTLLIPADSGLVLFEKLSGRTTRLDEYIKGTYRTPTTHPAAAMQAIEMDAANRRYTSIVDLEIAAKLARIASDRDTSLTIRYARDLRPNDLKSGNAILSGAVQANPWVQLFEQHMNFIVRSQAQKGSMSVENRSPKWGEPKQWNSTVDDPQFRTVGVVALMPNLTGDGDVLLLEGTTMSGTGPRGICFG